MKEDGDEDEDEDDDEDEDEQDDHETETTKEANVAHSAQGAKAGDKGKKPHGKKAVAQQHDVAETGKGQYSSNKTSSKGAVKGPIAVSTVGVHGKSHVDTVVLDGKKSRTNAQDKAGKTTLASRSASAKEKVSPTPALALSSKRQNAVLHATSTKTPVPSANTSSGRSSKINNDSVGKADTKKKDAKGGASGGGGRGGSGGGRGGSGGGGGDKAQGKSSAAIAKPPSSHPNPSSTQKRSVPVNDIKGGGMASKPDDAMDENDLVVMNKKRKTMESDIIVLEALAKAKFHMQEYTKLVWQQAEDKSAEDATTKKGESSSAADVMATMEADHEGADDAEESDAANDFDDVEELAQDEEDDQGEDEDDEDDEDDDDEDE